MARKTPRRRATRPAYATKADVARVHRIFDERRDWLEHLEQTCTTQFARIAQIQAKLDELERKLAKLTS